MKKINYKLDKDNYIVGYQTIPFDENKPSIEIADDYKIILGKTQILGGILTEGVGNNSYQRKQKKSSLKPLRDELKAIHQWLADNDWKVNKIITNEWGIDDERWLEYLAERTAKRARRDEILEILNK